MNFFKHSVCGQYSVALVCRTRHEKRIRIKKRKGADYDVPVKSHHAHQKHPVENNPKRRPPGSFGTAQHKNKSKQCCGDFTEDRCEGDPFHAPAEADDEPDAERNIQSVQKQLQQETRPGASETDEPSENGVICEQKRCA